MQPGESIAKNGERKKIYVFRKFKMLRHKTRVCRKNILQPSSTSDVPFHYDLYFFKYWMHIFFLTGLNEEKHVRFYCFVLVRTF